MQVYQIRLKLFAMQDITLQDMQEKMAAFIDSSFAENPELIKFHETNCYKNYCFDLPYKVDEDRIYHAGKIYTITIRTIDQNLANHFYAVSVHHHTNELKGLTAEIRILPKKIIETMFSLTPVILKSSDGYWKKQMSMEKFEEQLKINLIKKWNAVHEEKMNEDFELFTSLEFLNRVPVKISYKNIHLLGDKIRVQVASNETAQALVYMALGTGVGENNARGSGMMNYRWL